MSPTTRHPALVLEVDGDDRRLCIHNGGEAFCATVGLFDAADLLVVRDPEAAAAALVTVLEVAADLRIALAVELGEQKAALLEHAAQRRRPMPPSADRVCRGMYRRNAYARW